MPDESVRHVYVNKIRWYYPQLKVVTKHGESGLVLFHFALPEISVVSFDKRASRCDSGGFRGRGLEAQKRAASLSDTGSDSAVVKLSGPDKQTKTICSASEWNGSTSSAPDRTDSDLD
ncbi:hypothetical protein CEXT_641021 [Caerostris extrusa]|uniref:Uncharacterized protein n=1 Tax=Caerostris extrusa TaxID=172846 RepID=A0AAV4MY59_CAEEX|nr:hypothetical protein CEXT_641021 [Caerostris extrusa]